MTSTNTETVSSNVSSTSDPPAYNPDPIFSIIPQPSAPPIEEIGNRRRAKCANLPNIKLNKLKKYSIRLLKTLELILDFVVFSTCETIFCSLPANPDIIDIFHLISILHTAGSLTYYALYSEVIFSVVLQDCIFCFAFCIGFIFIHTTRDYILTIIVGVIYLVDGLYKAYLICKVDYSSEPPHTSVNLSQTGTSIREINNPNHYNSVRFNDIRHADIISS